MMKENAEKGYGIDGCPTTSELSESRLRHNFRLGDITWVKHSGSSWWPAQVIDEACVSSKPKKKTKHDALVRLYGTCQYLYVDPWKSNMEFETMLNQENKSAMEAFHEVLQKELSHVNSPCDHYEGAVNSKEIKVMVRDILLGDIIARQHDAEMAYVDEAIYGICDATMGNATHGGAAATKGGRGIKRVASRMEPDNYRITKNNNSKGNGSDSSPSWDAALEASGQLSARQIKIMQSLGLIAPSGSPFGSKGLF